VCGCKWPEQFLVSAHLGEPTSLRASQRMPIARRIVVPYIAGFGGVERLVLSLSRFLDSKQIIHEVLCFRDALHLGRYADWPITVKEMGGFRQSLFEAACLKRNLGGKRGLAGNEPLLFDLKGAFFASMAGLKGFALHLTDPVSLLQTESSRNSGAYRKWSEQRGAASPACRMRGELVHWINRRGVRRAEVVIAMTRRIAGELRALYGVQPTIIRPGVSRPRTGPVLLCKGEPKRLRVLSVSRLEHSKRVDAAIRALGDLGKNGRYSLAGVEWELTVAGVGQAQPELEQLALSLGLADHIHFCGRVSDEELDRLFNSTHIFVMPALQGYGLPALEALQRGVPVVVHSESGVSEILSGTPWVEIIADCEGLAPAMRLLALRIKEGELAATTLPPIPTDSAWAEHICRACGWMT
jgi:glycosyltransferase involved in cell wall biosynthesis